MSRLKLKEKLYGQSRKKSIWKSAYEKDNMEK